MIFFETIFAGFVGTLGMTFLMTIIHRVGWANADMIRALGSLVTRKYERSVIPGMTIHLASGILFAFPYAIVMGLVGTPSPGPMAGMGVVIGILHGIVFSFVLVAVVSEQHPVAKFQKAGPEVAVAHIAGHAAYGFLVGFTVGVLRIDWFP